MATITTFSTLKTAVADWLDRDDINDAIDQFIQIAEERIYRGGYNVVTQQRVPPVRIRAMETALSVVIASGVAAVPATYLELKNARLSTTPSTTLEPRPASWIYQAYPVRSAEGIPQFIARDGDNFIFGPYPDSGYTLTGIYYAKLTALSSSNETNWFTTNAPDLLLYGSLVASAGYVGSDERLAMWEQLFESARMAVVEQEDQEHFPAGMPLRAMNA